MFTNKIINIYHLICVTVWGADFELNLHLQL